MYGYLTTFIIVFSAQRLSQYVVEPAGIFAGILQGLIVLILQSPSEGGKTASLVLEILYWLAFFLWIYIKIQLARMQGITGALTQ